MKKSNPWALLPIGVFLVLYLGLGIVFEYVMKIPMGFYNIPIVIAFLAAILVACLQNRKVKFDDKLEIMAQGMADKNIITMLLIFMTAGTFVGVVGRSSAESVAYFMLSLIPAKFAVAVLFIVACFVSTAMGTSVGTITLITPIAAAVSAASGFSLPLCVASVMGGAMFGDNLSFISDTTIAACNGQGCAMKDKFRENFGIALPAALAALVLILVLSLNTDLEGAVTHEYNLIQIIPYILVLIGGIAGINVFIVLLVGIVSGSFIMLVTGQITLVDLLGSMGSGAAGMFETGMVAILVSAMCALIREYGGFEALLLAVKKVFKGKKGGQLGIGLLVGVMDVATANNTVAIVMANPIAAEMAKEYGVTPRKTASILDTFSCIFQGVIPYGAQMLVALSAVHEMGYELSAFDVIPKLFYPGLLLVSSLIFIFLKTEK
ncbi:Na+/H+ antiporter NhaC family protein [bacterium]|nr:Na+/H+ antiporter NhaC family protein [bacterium]MDY3022308.1 Na+/H+ antiporter NhaC family protein [Oliverpabstia sp.]